jgi:hypothetical protein
LEHNRESSLCLVGQGDFSKYYTCPDLNMNYRFLGVTSRRWAGWFAVYEFQVFGSSIPPTFNSPVVSAAPFAARKTLLWETNAAGGQNGTILVTAVNGLKFTLEQVNA